MRRSYTRAELALVQRLLAGPPLSNRQIEILSGVGRMTVAAIRDDRYPPLKKGLRSSDLDLGTDKDPRSKTQDPASIEYPNPKAEPIFCNTCRVWVYPPCLACQVRRLKRAG